MFSCSRILWKSVLKPHLTIVAQNVRKNQSIEIFKASKAKFRPLRKPAMENTIYAGYHLVTLLTDNSAESEQCCGYIEKIIRSCQAPITLEYVDWPADEASASEAIMSIRRNRAAIRLGFAHDVGSKRLQFVIRKSLNVFASVINLHSVPGYNCRFPELDMMLIIKSGQDDFTEVEYEPVKGVVKSLRHVVDDATFRFVCFVFHQTIMEGRKKITFVHNEAMLPLTEAHFRKIVENLRESFPTIEVDFRPLNYVVKKLIVDPSIFDVIGSSERYGSALTSISSAIAGGPNLYCCVMLSDEHSIFMPLHAKLSLADYKAVSAYGILRCCIDLMRFLGMDQFAYKVWCETHNAMMNDEVRTEEFGGTYTDTQFIDHVARQLYQNSDFPKDLLISKK